MRMAWSPRLSAETMPIGTEEVLRREANEIHDANLKEEYRGTKLYVALNQLGSAALCLSGGGIRSAAFALGVIQALAAPRTARLNGGGSELPGPDQSLLSTFHYLSTVSGGGYIGSWLSAWRLLQPFPKIWASLTGRPAGADVEPSELGWLRSYTNYLTPKIGITSADTWTATALVIRNLILNWLVILPMVWAAILLLKITGVASNWIIVWGEEDGWRPHWRFRDEWLIYVKFFIEIASGVAAALCLVLALAWIVRNRPTSRSTGNQGPTQGQFLWGAMFWSMLSAILLVHFLASDLLGNALLWCKDPNDVWKIGYLSICFVGNKEQWDWGGWTLNQARYEYTTYMGAGAVLGVLIYAAGWIAARSPKRDPRDLLAWAASGAVYGSLVGLGLFFFLETPDTGFLIPQPFMHFVFGVPWVLMSQLAATVLFVGVSSYKAGSDADREWLGRASGWFLTAAITWLLLTFLIFFGSRLAPEKLPRLEFLKESLPIVAGVSGLITAYFGKSSLLPALGNPEGLWQRVSSLIVSVAGVTFIATLVVVFGYAIDRLLFGHTLLRELGAHPHDWIKNTSHILKLLFYGLAISLTIGLLASRLININRFSLHALYRNRLIQAFLGAPRHRTPDLFTGFDAADNPRMHQLWSPVEPSDWRPFHIINVALNVFSSPKLAWQERKAEPFTISPLHSGSSYVGYRETATYGSEAGISLGTAMAISGAAANPNIGYNSSPMISFLMSLFNVRLGWWLANPGAHGKDSNAKEGPAWAILPLVEEALGLTTDNRKYVCLSDGGHFENLGLYEMVRRRCRFIVVSDASCDPNFVFKDLGNAIRKIAIDLGVPIRFHGLENLKKRPKDGSIIGADQNYHAIGEIDYFAADGNGENGLILYLKPGYHGVESAGLRDYAETHSDFPHESTMDQWFTESQFEAYRAVGFDITDATLRRALADDECASNPTLEKILVTLQEAAFRQKSVDTAHAGRSAYGEEAHEITAL